MIPIFNIINNMGICIAWTSDSEVAVKIKNQHCDARIKIEWRVENEEYIR